MKHLIYICGALLALTACHKEAPKEGREIITERPEQHVDNSIHSLQRLDVSDTAHYGRHRYQYRIVREVLDSSHVVVDDEGLRYLDNAVSLSVSCDGREILQRRITKSTFGDDLYKGPREHGILLNVQLDKAAPEGLIFNAILGSDELEETQVIFRLIVSPSGGFRYEIGDVFDEDDIQRIDDPLAPKEE